MSFQSLLLQVSFKTANENRRISCRVVSIPSPSGLLQNSELQEKQKTVGFNPFSFRSPSKPGEDWVDLLAKFQSLLLQVSFKTPTFCM